MQFFLKNKKYFKFIYFHQKNYLKKIILDLFLKIYLRVRVRNPRPHSAEQSLQAAHWPQRPLGWSTLAALCETMDTAVEQGGKLLQYWLSVSLPTQTRPPNEGEGFPQVLFRLFIPVKKNTNVIFWKKYTKMT